MSAFEFFQGIGNRVGALLKKEMDASAMSPTDAGGLLASPLTAMITRKVFLNNPLVALFAWQRYGTRKYPYRSVTTPAGSVAPLAANAATPVKSAAIGDDAYAYACERRRRVQVPGAIIRWSEFFGQSERNELVDVAQIQLNENIRGHSFDVSASLMHGNHAANDNDCTGICNLIIGSTNRVQAAATATALPEVPTTLARLDEAVAVAADNSDGSIENLYFVMSRRMLDKYSYLDQAATGKRINFSGITIAGGITMSSFKGVPILVCDVLSGKKAGTMGVVTPSTATTGGTIPDDTYYIYVSATTAHGESLACAEISQITAGGGTSTITLTFAAFQTPAPSFMHAQYYTVYLGTATGPQSCTPIIEVPAWTYDSAGVPTARTSITLTTITANSTVTGKTSDKPRILSSGSAPSEDVLLIDMNPMAQGLGRAFFNHYGGGAGQPDMFGMVAAKQLAETDDNTTFLLVSGFAPIPDHPESSTLIRGVASA